MPRIKLHAELETVKAAFAANATAIQVYAEELKASGGLSRLCQAVYLGLSPGLCRLKNYM